MCVKGQDRPLGSLAPLGVLSHSHGEEEGRGSVMDSSWTACLQAGEAPVPLCPRAQLGPDRCSRYCRLLNERGGRPQSTVCLCNVTVTLLCNVTVHVCPVCSLSRCVPRVKKSNFRIGQEETTALTLGSTRSEEERGGRNRAHGRPAAQLGFGEEAGHISVVHKRTWKD